MEQLNELALFAGAGGGILGGKLLGWRTVCAVEWEQYPASVLCARQNDGILPPFPIWDDVQTFDGKPWRGIVDVVSGGFPCQDISAAGKGAGIDGERSGMWGEMARIICEVRPRYVFVENSPMLTSRGLGRVLGDLAAMGFDARWGVLGAADVGANHQRDRIWIVARQRERISYPEHHRVGRGEQQQESIKKTSRNLADTNGVSSQVRGNDFANEAIGGKRDNDNSGSPSDDWGKFDTEKNVGVDRNANGNDERTQREICSRKIANASGVCSEVAHAESAGQPPRQDETPKRVGRPLEKQFRGIGIGASEWWQSEPNVGRVADGVAAKVDRLKAIGNGQVPLCAATAWRILSAGV